MATKQEVERLLKEATGAILHLQLVHRKLGIIRPGRELLPFLWQAGKILPAWLARIDRARAENEGPRQIIVEDGND